MTMTAYDFFNTEVDDDDIGVDESPPLENVEYPCQVCGKEAGPYGGRGRKPKFCPEHKKTQTKTGPKVTGSSATLAAQATKVLVQYNGFMSIGCMAMQYFQTAGAIAQANDLFEKQIYEALLTDTELCKLILKSGNMSAKMSLGMAYASLAFTVVPTAYMEFKEKKAAREVQLEDA